MKKTFLARYASGALCAAGAALGGVFCVTSAFAVPVDAVRLAGLCLGLALLLPLPLCARHRGRWLTGVLLAALLWLYADWESVKNGLLLTAEAVAWHYGRAFELFSGIETVHFGLPAETEATAFFVLLGGVLALCAAQAARDGWLLPLAAVSVPLLVLCLMVVNTVPAPWAVLPLAGVWTVLLLSQSLRSRDPEAGQRLLLRLALPAAALMLLLCLAVRPSDYTRPRWPDTLQEKLQSAVDRVEELFAGKEDGDGDAQSLSVSSGLDTLSLSGWNAELDLGAVGPQSKSGRRVMEVLFPKSGRYYLRGNSLAVYDGESWAALPASAYQGLAIGEDDWLASGGDGGEARIKTDKKAGIYYLPYTPTALPDGAALYYDAYVRNTGYEKDYTVSYADGESGLAALEGYEEFVNASEHYLQVPRSTRNDLEPVLKELEERLAAYGYDADLVAEVVADYVRSSAVYDLDTPRMPRGEDFVSWFLLESDTGYCVHFASAAAILLRCEGVPARYVSGYVVTARAGDWTPVLSDDAHAWVEYYVAGEGWKVLEATPAAPAEPEPTPAAEETAPPRETQAPAAAGAQETPAPSASAETRPGTGTGGSGGAGSAFRVPGWLWAALAVVLLPVLWRFGVRALRRRAFEKGTPSDRALACYHSVCRLSRFTGTAVPRFVRETAEKARFSRSGVSEEELRRLLDYADTLQAAARADENIPRRLLCRVVFGL
ncbi:MAG: transglutaminase domain-containing protein [Oscillospiraceae bacterium]